MSLSLNSQAANEILKLFVYVCNVVDTNSLICVVKNVSSSITKQKRMPLRILSTANVDTFQIETHIERIPIRLLN